MPPKEPKDDRPLRPSHPSMLYKNEEVTRILLDNGLAIEVQKASYKEYRPTGSGPEVFLAIDSSTGEYMVGPTNQIKVIWFTPERPSPSPSTTE